MASTICEMCGRVEAPYREFRRAHLCNDCHQAIRKAEDRFYEKHGRYPSNDTGTDEGRQIWLDATKFRC